MGRLQRKKTAKKKKPATGEGSAPEAESSKSAPGQGGAKKAAMPQKKPTAAIKPPEQRNFIEKSMQFLREVKVELKKVAWPTRKQTVGSTVVVIILVMIIAFFLGGVDFFLSYLIRTIL